MTGKAMSKTEQEKALAALDAKMAQEVAAVSDTLTNASGAFIKIDQSGGQFFEVPELGKAESPLDVVILDYITHNYYYTNRYDPNNIVPPDCFAIGKKPKEMRPDSHIVEPLDDGEGCDACPMNQFGSDGNGKACKNYRILAVLPPDAASDAEILMVKVSPTGLKRFDQYVSGLSKKFVALPSRFITELSIVPSGGGSGFTLAFGNPRKLDAETAIEMESRRAEAQAMLEAVPSSFTQAPQEEKQQPRKVAKKRVAKKAPARRARA